MPVRRRLGCCDAHPASESGLAVEGHRPQFRGVIIVPDVASGLAIAGRSTAIGNQYPHWAAQRIGH